MLEHSETTPTPPTSSSMERYMHEVSMAIGRLIVAASADVLQLRDVTWTGITTTSQGDHAAWRVQVTRDATP